MKSTKQDIIDFAKNLYMEVDAEGRKLHTWRSISTSVQKKFKKDVNYSTIAKWAVKYDWENTFEKIKMVGIEKGKQQLQEKENLIVDEKSEVIADIYKSNKQLHKITKQTILARLTGQQLKDNQGVPINTDFSPSDLIRVLQHSEATLLELQDKKKPESSDKVNIPIIRWTK